MFRDLTKSRRERSHPAITYLALYGLAVTVPLLVLLAALLLHSASVQRAQLEDRVAQVLDTLLNDIDRDLDRDITILHTLGTSRALATADWPTFYNEAKAGLQGRAYLVLIDTRGRQLVNTYVPYGEQPAMTGDPETLRRITQSKGPVISNLFISLVVKKPVFNVSIPILQDSQIRYVMSLGLLPDDLLALLAAQNLGPEWVTLIWDANGVILARSRDNARYLGQPLPQNMRERNQRAVVRTTNLDGMDVLHATARSQISGWGIGVNVPYSLITEQMRSSLLLWGIAAILAVTMALVLGLLLARQITTALSIAAEAATAFGHDQSFPLTGSRLKEADSFLDTLAAAQQKLAQRKSELKHAEERFRLAVEAAPTGMILANGEGQIVLINDRVERMLGYSRKELIGQGIDLLVPDRFRTRHPDYRAGYLRKPSMRLMGAGRDLFARRRDGSEVAVEIGLSSINVAEGLMTLCTIADITERKAAQEREKILVREVQHRSSNLLAVIQAIAYRSLRGNPFL
jgi:PAS domain S-box-containing protein